MYVLIYVHKFVYVQSCMVKHDLTNKGHMTNCCQLLITTNASISLAETSRRRRRGDSGDL